MRGKRIDIIYFCYRIAHGQHRAQMFVHPYAFLVSLFYECIF